MAAKVKVDIYKYKGASPILVDEGVDVTFKQLQNFIDSTVYRVLYSDDGTVATEDNIMDKFYGAGAADAVSYDNTESGLTAENVQSAIDEVAQGGGGGGGSDTEWVINVDPAKLDRSTDVYSGDHPTYEEFIEGLKNGKSRLVVNCLWHRESGTVYGICHSSVETTLHDLEYHESDSLVWFYRYSGDYSDNIMAKISSDNVMELYHLGFE